MIVCHRVGRGGFGEVAEVGFLLAGLKFALQLVEVVVEMVELVLDLVTVRGL